MNDRVDQADAQARERLRWLGQLRWWAMAGAMAGTVVATALEWSFTSPPGLAAGVLAGVPEEGFDRLGLEPLEIRSHADVDHAGPNVGGAADGTLGHGHAGTRELVLGAIRQDHPHAALRQPLTDGKTDPADLVGSFRSSGRILAFGITGTLSF